MNELFKSRAFKSIIILILLLLGLIFRSLVIEANATLATWFILNEVTKFVVKSPFATIIDLFFKSQQSNRTFMRYIIINIVVIILLFGFYRLVINYFF